MFPIAFTCIDNSLGKMDPSMLSDQARMELAVAGLADESCEELRDNEGAFLDACEWVTTKCDSDGNVTDLCLETTYWGTLCLDHFPQSLNDIRISCNGNLTGMVDTALLPPRLTVLHLDDNSFIGSVGMTALPATLEYFDIQENKFSGGCDLTALPSSLEELIVCDNLFRASLCLETLPDSILLLDVSSNAFTGSFSLEKLPENLSELHINNNRLSGSFVLSKPGSLDIVCAHSNNFLGVAAISSKFARAGTEITLRNTNITSVVTESGAVHPRRRRILMEW